MSILPPLPRLWKFNGGLHLPDHKAESTGRPVQKAPLPAQLILPLQQHVGAPAKPVVQPGEQVHKGQRLAQADGYLSAPIHAPTSGQILAIEERPIAHPSGLTAPCIVLATDGLDTWGEPPPLLADYVTLDPAILRQRVGEAGIVGLGGAMFPTAVKLDPAPARPVKLLILNGAECEPYITCDDMLMRARSGAVVKGLLIMQHILQAEEAIIAVEDNKPEAITALQQALSELAPPVPVRIQTIPTLYPSGGEKQMIHVLTGLEVPSHGLPADIGIVCQNVGTAAAVRDTVIEGKPLISRYVTVTGRGVAQPQVLEVLIGTPVRDLIGWCGGYTPDLERLILGGPMMGFTLPSDQVPITKGGNCILAAGKSELAPSAPAMPCIRCGACVQVCPADLLPQQLYWHTHAKDFDKVQEYHLFDCIECGCCAAVCPSHIPLVQYYRYAKTEIRALEREKEKADLARRRHEARLARLEREQREKEEKHRKRREMLHEDGASSAEDHKKAAIAAAVARVQAKKTAVAVAEPPAALRRSEAETVAEHEMET
jgi:electron transport complex protein RnfC